MASSPQDVQAKLDQAVSYLQTTTSSYTQMVKKYGSDWSKWPVNSKWYLALADIESARAEVGNLTSKVLTSKFLVKES